MLACYSLLGIIENFTVDLEKEGLLGRVAESESFFNELTSGQQLDRSLSEHLTTETDPFKRVVGEQVAKLHTMSVEKERLGRFSCEPQAKHDALLRQ